MVPVGMAYPSSLRICAQLADGSWHLVGVHRCRPHALPSTSDALIRGVRTGELVRAAFTLRRAYRKAGVEAPGWSSLVPGLALLRRKFATGLAGKRVKPVPRKDAGSRAEPRVLIVTHNLNREGAPLFLLELARYIAGGSRMRLTVISPFEGELRNEFEALGATVQLVDRSALWCACDARSSTLALSAMSRELRADRASVVIANTVESFWAVRAAHHAGTPSLFYIHEPGVLGHHYLASLCGEVRRQTAAAIECATCVSFPSRAVQAYYEPFSNGSNYRIQPGWTNFEPNETLPTNALRSKMRAHLQLAATECLIITVGRLCARKDQLGFMHAAEHLWQTAPDLAVRCRFVAIGAHEDDYGAQVAAEIIRLGRTNCAIVPATESVQDYFAAADIFVLSSFEEGFPRVLLEAMAFGLPIVTTDIHGIPEIVRHEREALLVPPGDHRALAAALAQMLREPARPVRLGEAARTRLFDRFSAEHVLPGHLATIRQLAPSLGEPASKTHVHGWSEYDPASC